MDSNREKSLDLSSPTQGKSCEESEINYLIFLGKLLSDLEISPEEKNHTQYDEKFKETSAELYQSTGISFNINI